MRAVLDTNVLVSGQLWRGAPHLLLNYVRDRRVALILSPALLAEVEDVIFRAKFRAILHKINRTPERILTELRLIAEFVDASALLAPVCRDPDDDKVLAAAVAARADCVVSGDLDLLSLEAFQGIRILTPAAAVDWISAR